MTIASTTKPPESPHEKAPGRFFRIFTSLLLCLDEDTFHALTIVASGIERILADVVAVTLKAVNSIQINNLRPVDAHEVRMLCQHLFNPPQPMIRHLVPLIRQEYDASILEGSHPHNLVIPHLLPLLISLHEEAVTYYIRNLLTVFNPFRSSFIVKACYMSGKFCNFAAVMG